MKHFLVILELLLLFNSAYSQIIKGYVLDNTTNNKISYATVYLNGTYIGTNTDQNGYFKLTITEGFSLPLTISAIGYYSGTLTNYLSDTLNLIYLEPKVYELNEVIISAKADPGKRQEYLQLFRKEFLGTTIIGTNCKILNEKDISFSYNLQTNTFRAYSTKPVIIDNSYLGYKIEYYLDKFEFHYLRNIGRITGLIIGNYKFLESNYKNSKQKNRFEDRRRTAYLGSRMHFIRELWKNNLDSSGFELRDSLNNKVYLKSNFIDSQQSNNLVVSKYLKFDGSLYLSYKPKKDFTIITMSQDKMYFNNIGFFDPYAIRWEGKMAEQRIGDILPFEYQYKAEARKK